MTSIDRAWPQTAVATPWVRTTVRARATQAPFLRLYELLSSQIADGAATDARRMAWRAVRSPMATLGWLGALDQLCARSGVAAIPFDLARKPGQSFLHPSLQQSARINLLTTHYDRLSHILGLRMVGGLLSSRPIVLPAIKGRSGTLYRLSLSRSEQNRREGELNVRLIQEDSGACLASLGLVVGAPRPGQPMDLWIGGLQGCKGEDSKAVTVQATRDLSGLRPKDLLVHTAYALAELFEVRSIKAISNDGHVHRCAKGERSWSADYDAFWRELGGEPIKGGFFRLPKTRQRRAEDDVAPAKRKAWRARYALVDAVRGDILRLADKS